MQAVKPASLAWEDSGNLRNRSSGKSLGAQAGVAWQHLLKCSCIACPRHTAAVVQYILLGALYTLPPGIQL